MTRHFALEAKRENKIPIVIFHNGTAQRGHTVDYDATHRHVYHHFGSGTGDGIATFFAETFYIHPMEFHREYNELVSQGIHPNTILFDPNAKIITPFDMVVDHATEEWIAKLNGEREFGSCGFGSWCAIEDRYPLGRTNYTIADFMWYDNIPFLMEEIWKDCLSILVQRGVDLEQTSFAKILKDRTVLINNFINDLKFFFSHTGLLNFNGLFNHSIYNSFIFENGQGLGLDMNVDNNWHTTSNTGLINPYNMLKDKEDFKAEVCYVSRSYLTRHGIGPIEQETKKNNINADMWDKTNVFNPFQGNLRFGFNEENKEMFDRIEKDWAIAKNNPNFSQNIAITHTNEFNADKHLISIAKYKSNNPYKVEA